MRLLYRYRVVRINRSPTTDETLHTTLTLKAARRKRAVLRLAGERHVGVIDSLTGRFV